jgi:hypothetical protein
MLFHEAHQVLKSHIAAVHSELKLQKMPPADTNIWTMPWPLLTLSSPVMPHSIIGLERVNILSWKIPEEIQNNV